MITKTLFTAAALALGLGLSAPAFAEDEAALDAATQAKVTETLTSQGYEVRKVGMEDGMIEAYAVKDGKMYEVYLDKDMKIVRTNEQG